MEHFFIDLILLLARKSMISPKEIKDAYESLSNDGKIYLRLRSLTIHPYIKTPSTKSYSSTNCSSVTLPIINSDECFQLSNSDYDISKFNSADDISL